MKVFLFTASKQHSADKNLKSFICHLKHERILHVHKSNGNFILILGFLCVDVSYSIQTWLFCAWGILQRIRWCKTLKLIFWGGGGWVFLCCEVFLNLLLCCVLVFSFLLLAGIRRFRFYCLEVLVKSIVQNPPFSCSGVEMDQFCTVL